MSGLLLKMQAFARRSGLGVAIVYLGLLLAVFGHHCGPQDRDDARPGCASPDSRHFCGVSYPDPLLGHHCPICSSQRHQSGTVLAPQRYAAPALRVVAAAIAPLGYVPQHRGEASLSRGPPVC